MTLGQRAGSKGASHTAILGKSASGRRRASVKALRQEPCLACLRNSEEARVSGGERRKVICRRCNHRDHSRWRVRNDVEPLGHSNEFGFRTL